MAIEWNSAPAVGVEARRFLPVVLISLWRGRTWSGAEEIEALVGDGEVVGPIVTWLANLWHGGVDLNMLAAEAATGGLAGEEYASYLSDDGSDTLTATPELRRPQRTRPTRPPRWSDSHAVNDHEADDFLALLARTPDGAAAVRVVRDPDSLEGRRRADRVRRYMET